MEWLVNLLGGGTLGKIVESVATYKLVDLLLGRHLGAVLLLASAWLAWKLTQMHRDEDRSFDWDSLPGYVAAVVTLLVAGVGVKVLLF